MGFPMAGHLKTRGGHAVTVFNRTRAKADAWIAKFGGARRPPGRGGHGADFVFACVGNDDDLRAVTLGRRRRLSGAWPGAVFVDHTTASAGGRARVERGGQDHGSSLSTRRSRVARPAQ